MSATGSPPTGEFDPTWFTVRGATRRALCRMLGAAEQVEGPDPPGKDQALAGCFRELLCEPDLRPAEVPRFRELDDLIRELPDDNQSTVGALDPYLALACQAKIGAELALDLVYDRRRVRCFPLVTRGTSWGVFSDLGFYLGASPDYLVIPCFHTHPEFHNELGEEMPSLADYRNLARLHAQLGGADVCDLVYFPNGHCTLYGVDARGRWFHRRQGRPPGDIPCRDWTRCQP